MVKNPPAMQETEFDPWVGKIPWRREQLHIPVFWPGELHGLYSPWGHAELDTTERLLLSGGTSGKDPTCQCGGCKRCSIDPWIGKISWRRAWQPPPVFLPGEFHGQRGLVGYHPRGCKESNTTEHLSKCKLSVPSPRRHSHG